LSKEKLGKGKRKGKRQVRKERNQAYKLNRRRGNSFQVIQKTRRKGGIKRLKQNAATGEVSKELGKEDGGGTVREED